MVWQLCPICQQDSPGWVSIPAALAAVLARPTPSAHSIWEILLHVSASAELVISRLIGEARTLSPEEDWPAPPAVADQDAWEADVRRLAEVHRELIEELSTLGASRLDAPIVPGFSSIYVFALHDLVQHTPARSH